MHGFSLSDCEYFVSSDGVHPLVKRCYTLLKQFHDAHGIVIKYNTLGLSIDFGLYRVVNVVKELEYFINIFCNKTRVTGGITIAIDDTDKYNDLLSLKPTAINLLYLDKSGKKYSKVVDVTNSIL